ncbi:MAG: serine/threonine-protein kinase [Kofleriaceae bacterium]
MPQLGRYEILQRLARGSVADVLLARASGLEGFARHVVIKQIRAEHAADTRFVTAFLDEARIGASLHHQNIVQVFDIDQVGGSPYFAMEYVHGENVRQVLARICSKGLAVPVELIVAIGAAAAAGLHHAHEHHGPDRKPLDLVHRDVSPSNILIGYDGSVKLVDFGLAKPALRGAKTRTGALCKAPYMSPELCLGKPIDRRSDIFALGIVLYELATARRLFKGDNDYLTMAMIVEGDVPPPSSLRPELPKALDEIIMRALAKAPGARFQTANDLRSALESFAIEHELRTSAKAVRDFLSGLFGARVEPWHAPQDTAAIDASDIDFDDAPHGLVSTPSKGVELATIDGAAPIALAHEVAHGTTPDPDPAFDENPTRIDLEDAGDEFQTLTGGPVTMANLVADSTTTAAQPIVDVLATGQQPSVREMHATAQTITIDGTIDETTGATDETRTLEDADDFATLRDPAIRVPASIPPRPAALAPRPPPAILHAPPPLPRLGVDAHGTPAPRVPAPPILPATPPPSSRVDSDAGDEATTVEPPLFPMPEPVFHALPPDQVYVAPPVIPNELPPLHRWGLVGAVLLIPLVIGLIAHACRH